LKVTVYSPSLPRSNAIEIKLLRAIYREKSMKENIAGATPLKEIINATPINKTTVI